MGLISQRKRQTHFPPFINGLSISKNLYNTRIKVLCSDNGTEFHQ